MKIIPRITLQEKDGTQHLPGTETEVPDEVGEDAVSRGLADRVASPPDHADEGDA